MSLILIYLSLIIAICVTNPVIIICTELGHALSCLLLTNPDNIDIFIGSYGDTEAGLNFKVGKLHFYFNPSFPFILKGGLSRASKMEPNYLNCILTLLAGPIFTVLLACIIGAVVFNTEVHGAIKLYCFALILFSVLRLVRSLIPKHIKAANKDNNGKQIAFLLRTRDVYANYVAAIDDELNNEKITAVEKLLKIVEVHPKEEIFLRLLVPLLIEIKSSDLAKKYLIDLKTVSSFTATDYLNMGYLHSLAGERTEAIKNFREGMAMEPERLLILNMLAGQLMLTDAYEEAIEIFEKVINLVPNKPDTYDILGYLNILAGRLDTAKTFLDKSLWLNPSYSRAYKHLGIFYLKTNEKENAIINFKKAAELDSNINIDSYLQEAQLIN
jgi:tetratricopeptide (TPR) repeat protein